MFVLCVLMDHKNKETYIKRKEEVNESKLICYVVVVVNQTFQFF